jgi:hypothetical protein
LINNKHKNKPTRWNRLKRIFFERHGRGDEKKGFILFNSLVAVISGLIFAGFGWYYAKLSYNLALTQSKDEKLIDTLAKMTRESKTQTSLIIKQVESLKKIYASIDSTNKAAQALEQLNRKVSIVITADIKKASDGWYDLEKVWLTNYGKIECEIKLFRFKVTRIEYLIQDSILNTLSGHLFDIGDQTFQLNHEKVVEKTINVGAPLAIPLNGALRFPTKDILLQYILVYKNQYENGPINGYMKVNFLK